MCQVLDFRKVGWALCQLLPMDGTVGPWGAD